MGNFRGGRKLSPKPSAFESEIHPPHKPSVYAPGYFALAGGFGSTLGVLLISMRPKGRDAWMALLFAATFLGRYATAFCDGLSAAGRRENLSEKKFIYRNGKAA